MSQKIPIEVLSLIAGDAIVKKSVLTGEIVGVKTIYHVLPANSRISLSQDTNSIHILFFIDGNGSVSVSEKEFSIIDQTLFIPSKKCEIKIKSQSRLELLEIVWQLTEPEFVSVKEDLLPYILKYSEAKTYKEAIKSPKTVNRTLVHEDLIPRFCMGSVETEGPDAVGAHRHPMLEQHFFGLPGNSCHVKADDAEISFPERALLHIPLGSEHSVRVDGGHKLHYIWIDYFRDAEGVDWIKKMHKSDK